MIKHLSQEPPQQLLCAQLRNCCSSCRGETLCEHPAYSPDLAPSDYHMFKHLKRCLVCQHLPNDENVTPVYRNGSHGITRASVTVVLALRGS
ncbi:hypothetical protein AVEN_231715-1 [Araneus ventricosus]|uniref:Tc1-like transposase DDE domain-containing protein n=1 Tax=Araneus ventricosus TaxID=182803 RepID=A0A4Y2B9M9_ARAVE|nr:hypothetical protein AVEN_231715-1 [Araneus ventricosus]